MAVTIEDLYRNYGVLADAKDNLSQVSKGSGVNFTALWNTEMRFFAAVLHFTSTVVNFVDLRNRADLCAKLTGAS